MYHVLRRSRDIVDVGQGRPMVTLSMSGKERHEMSFPRAQVTYLVHYHASMNTSNTPRKRPVGMTRWCIPRYTRCINRLYHVRGRHSLVHTYSYPVAFRAPFEQSGSPHHERAGRADVYSQSFCIKIRSTSTWYQVSPYEEQQW